MIATIKYEVPDGLALGTARPDALWKILVETFMPEKGEATGDSDPYGVGSLDIRSTDLEKLNLLRADGWHELDTIIRTLDFATLIVLTRDP